MRIVSLAPSNTEILFALGAGEDVVAVTRFCDWPPDVKAVRAFGSWLSTEEKVLRELKPDLILTSMWMPEQLKNWDGSGEIVHVDPKNLWDVFDSIRKIGETVGRVSQAKKIIGDMEVSFNALRVSSADQRPHVYMEEWFEPPMSAGNWVPEIVAIAGAEQVLAEVNQPSKTFPLAALTVANPDLMICHWCGWGERTQIERVRDRIGWEDLRVVRGDRIFFVNDSLINRPGPRLVEGAQALQHIFSQFQPT